MSTTNAILATLSDSGPANMRELFDTLYATREVRADGLDHDRVCLELYGLVRAGQVTVSCGVYSAA